MTAREPVSDPLPEEAPSPEDAELFAIMTDFELTYSQYAEMQDRMEHYWCLRWLLQENVTTVVATVLRENLCRFDELPLVARVPSVPQVRSGTPVVLDISKVDLLDLSFHAEFVSIAESSTTVAEANS